MKTISETMNKVYLKHKQSIIFNNHPINEYQQFVWLIHLHQPKIISISKQDGRKRERWGDDHNQDMQKN